MEFGGGGENFPHRRRKQRRRRVFKVQGKQQRGRGRKKWRLSAHISSFLLISVQHSSFGSKSSVYSKQQNPKNTKRSPPHPRFFTSQPMYSKCYRHTGMHPPSPSLHCSILSVFKGRSAHTFEGEGLHVCEGRVPSSMNRCPIQKLAGMSQHVRSTSHSRPSTTAIKH